jgi:hypothetical protein
MRLTKLLLGVRQAPDKVGILDLRLLLEVGHFLERTSGGGWLLGQAVHSGGVEGGVKRHIRDGVFGRSVGGLEG